MYAVVGCTECDALWVVEGRPETTTCRRCGRRYRFDSLRSFAETESEDAARDARSRLLADRRGEDVTDFGTLAERAEEAGVSDEAYLAGSGLDPDEVSAAVERGDETTPRSRRAVLESALDSLDDPTEEAVVTYATERGIPAVAVREALAKLVQSGEVTRTDGVFRML